MPDLAEYPGVADRRATDHDAVDAKTFPVIRGFFRAVDIAVAKDGNMEAGIVFYPPDKGPIRLALVKLAAGTAVDGQGLNARVLEAFSDRFDVLVILIPAQPCLDGHGQI